MEKFLIYQVRVNLLQQNIATVDTTNDTEFNDAKDDNLSEEMEHEYIKTNEQHYIINYAKENVEGN